MVARLRIAWLLLPVAASCAPSGPPAATNGMAGSRRPPAPAASPRPPQSAAEAYRAANETNEEHFRYGSVPHLGEAIIIDGTSIRPLEVIEDSRCPVDARCVQAGRVRVRVQVVSSGGGFRGEAVMEIGRPMDVVIENGRLELRPAEQITRFQQLVLDAVAPLRWVRPPAGVDAHARKRFAFSLID